MRIVDLHLSGKQIFYYLHNNTRIEFIINNLGSRILTAGGIYKKDFNIIDFYL